MFSRSTLVASMLRHSRRSISTTCCRNGRRSRKPWDQRFPVHEKDVAPDVHGGSIEMAEALPEKIIAPTGIVHRVTGEYIHVPEMVPEFVVPDLTDFELKPYVSYRVKEISQAPLKPKDVFNSVYAADIEDAYRDGKIKVEGGKVLLQDGQTLDLDVDKDEDIKSN